MPRELERHLIVERMPAETLASVLAGEESGQFPLDQGPLDQGVMPEYGDWDLVSHTFDVQDDGTAILTLIFETRTRRSR